MVLDKFTAYAAAGPGNYYVPVKDSGIETIFEPAKQTIGTREYDAVVVAVPVRYNGEIIAVVGAHVDMAAIARAVASIHPYETGFASLAAASGRVVAHARQDQAGFQLDPEILRAVSAITSAGHGYARDGYLAPLGMNTIEAHVPIRIDQTKDTWVLSVYIPMDRVLVAVHHAMYVFCALGLGALLFLNGVICVFSRLITKPLSRLAERRVLRRLVDSLPDLIFVKDTESRYLLLNMACARQLGADRPDDVLGKTDADFVAPELARQYRADEIALMRSGRPVNQEERTQHKDTNELGWSHTIKVPLQDEAGNVVGLVGIARDITPKKRDEERLDALNKRMLTLSREAGMAEMATGMLHNVGNVLNSVTVSAGLVAERLSSSKINGVARLARLLKEQGDGLARFFAEDARGRTVPAYLEVLAAHLEQERLEVGKELSVLLRNIDHIKEIIAMQQNYARVSGVVETVALADLVEDAIKMHSSTCARHGITLERDYEQLPPVSVDKHKVLQILVNLIRNSMDACDATNLPGKRVTFRIRACGPEGATIEVADTGVGIPPENLPRIFSHGFTTRKGGHGFGLHSAALTANALGGSLTVYSEGPGHGAAFTLKLPFKPPPSGQKKL